MNFIILGKLFPGVPSDIRRDATESLFTRCQVVIDSAVTDTNDFHFLYRATVDISKSSAS